MLDPEPLPGPSNPQMTSSMIRRIPVLVADLPDDLPVLGGGA